MQLIETVTVGAEGLAAVEFSSIPQNYQDLLILFSLRTTQNAYFSASSFLLNGNLTNRSHIELEGDGSFVYTATATFFPTVINGNSVNSDTFGNGQIYISNYSATDRGKPLSGDFVTENNGTSARLQIYAALWDVNDAVTSCFITTTNEDFVAGSTVSLYGINNS